MEKSRIFILMYLECPVAPNCTIKKIKSRPVPLGWTRPFYMVSDGKLSRTSIIVMHHGKENN